LTDLLKDNSTVQLLNSTLQSLCKEIPVVSSECQAVVNEYLPLLIGVITSMSPQDVCYDLRLCSSQGMHIHQTPPLFRKLAAQGVITCDICKVVTTEILKLLQTTSIQDKVTNEVENLCGLLPSSVSGECKEAAEEYLPEIFQLISSLDPAEFCSFFGICSSDSFLLKREAFAEG
jgi:saposin